MKEVERQELIASRVHFMMAGAQGGIVSRKKVRTLGRRDVEPLQLDSLSTNIELIPAR
jgi:hypothetical protein